jgi:Plavaka transposase
MVKFRCKICGKKFSTSYGLTQHRNAKHHGRTTLSQTSEIESQRTRHRRPIEMPEHDANLWNALITMVVLEPESASTILVENPLSEVDNDEIEDVIEDVVFEETPLNVTSDMTRNKSEPRYNLRSQVHNVELDDVKERDEENDEEDCEENNEDYEANELSLNLENVNFDLEDLQGASLDDALDTIEGKNKPESIANYPNDAYRDFMELIIEGNISNKIGDKIIKFFNKHSALDKSPLPSSTKNEKDFINQIDSPSLDFKKKVVATYDEVNFILHYRPIFRAIQVLIQRSEVSDNFVTKGILKKDGTRIFGELYEGNWWLETEKTLPPMNNLLSIILYSDATTLDGLGKSSGHPVFLTLGNLLNRVRNLSESKVLLGFLPKVQDTGIKTSKNFQRLQHEVYHKCFDIMLRPLLKKPDALYFGIKGRPMTFAARISLFLADMLEADDVTATYKSAQCKMPCHTCMVLQRDLNNMNIALENMPLRTHENMQEIIMNGQNKDYSVHSVENTFWKFL